MQVQSPDLSAPCIRHLLGSAFQTDFIPIVRFVFVQRVVAVQVFHIGQVSGRWIEVISVVDGRVALLVVEFAVTRQQTRIDAIETVIAEKHEIVV